MLCYRKGGCGPYEMYSCSECPASKPEYADRHKEKGTENKMNAKLIVEGKEFDIEILDPKLQELIAPTNKTGYEKATNEDGTFYFDNGAGYVQDSYDSYPETDGNNAYKAANYYTSKTVAENNTRADKLMRQLRRFAVEHRNNELNWKNSKQNKFLISYDYSLGDVDIEYEDDCRELFTIFFDTRQTAQQAIDTFRDELIWYFTEYKDSL